ncbi:MAG: dTDP-4-dehydrorhamnose 3,5-epimerase [Flavobacteriales bacterium]|nr:dTDP-4-dehydrorhamnose 3,5-epimerase [Flavobacteriales bacterium]MCB9180865.1 dTDP-4-dehydrorhamnose 3,5-epimerase [Flavobacteriales bacterium]MCB9199770.1 dTDP-4-dehydrorhamnose 3,5-epimerase [Flavobacteriales bacterium]HPF66557.1 dTDP-4-dehydrorhamnose 3,5-epimerase [Flavobacteriales bacterium]HPQ57743.1 dTDP-4-dehydrorhamnose 3,5-epimerase [Flavobacteriales bacterium]
MELLERFLGDALLLGPTVHGDARGYFLEPYNSARFSEVTGLSPRFVQDNESMSLAGVVRGLHIQAMPHTQAKLVRVVKGSVLDVCVDVRAGSPTYGRHFKVRLDDREKRMLYVPEGFAHGFHTLEDGTIFQYKCTAFYDRPSERTLLWNDPALGIDWEVRDPVLSEKDRQGVPLSRFSWNT